MLERRIGRGFTLGGLYVGVPFAILGIVGFNLPRDWVLLGVGGAVLGGVGGISALVGIFFWLFNNGTVEVDTTARTLLFPDGDRSGFDDVATVAMLNYVHEMRTRHGTQKQMRYQVAVVGQEVGHDAKAEIDTMRESIDRLAGGEELTAGEKEAVEVLEAAMHERLERMLPLLGEVTRPVLDHSNVLVSWQVAERLAKLLDVPLLDLWRCRSTSSRPCGSRQISTRIGSCSKLAWPKLTQVSSTYRFLPFSCPKGSTSRTEMVQSSRL